MGKKVWKEGEIYDLKGLKLVKEKLTNFLNNVGAEAFYIVYKDSICISFLYLVSEDNDEDGGGEEK